MKRILVVLLFALLVEAVSSASEASEKWTLVKKSNGITSYERKIPGTSLKEFRAVTLMDAGMEVIGEALRDVPSYPKWLADCSSARIEKRYDRNTMVLHLALTPPILKLRDVVLITKSYLYWDYGKVHTFLIPTNEVEVPPLKGSVRVTTMKCTCEMSYMGRNKTKFVYSIVVDPNVRFPLTIGMTYPILKNYPHRSLEKLRVLVLDRKYAELAKGTDEQKGIDMRTRNEAATWCIFTYGLQPYVRDKAVFRSVMEGRPEIPKTMVSNGSTYECNKKCTLDAFAAYIEKTVPDKQFVQRLRNDRAFKADLLDMVETSCGEDGRTVDSLVEEYRNK